MVRVKRSEMVKKAKILANNERLGHGKTLCGTSLKDISRLGVGIQLYFMLMKYLSILFLFMSILAAPSIFFHYYGKGITPEMADPIGLSFVSLGNEGLNMEYNTTEYCLPKGEIDCTLETINNPIVSNPYYVSYIISLSDICYSFLFFLFIYYFKSKIKYTILESNEQNITPSDYAIYVRGLPTNATEEQILKHFSTLYNLSQPHKRYPMYCGCFGRSKVSKKKNYNIKTNVITNIDHLGHETENNNNNNNIYLNTYIAQVAVAHPTGGLLRTFLANEHLTGQIAVKKSIIKLYKETEESNDATLKEKKNAIKFRKKIERTLLNLQLRLEKNIKYLKLLRNENLKTNKEKKNQKVIDNTNNNTDILSSSDECECAFVVFNHIEGKLRCLDDYRNSTHWLAKKFQPKSLCFSNDNYKTYYPLEIVSAPEPSNIIWENLEISSRNRFYRRCLTNFITLLLLLISCGIIYSAQIAQSSFQKNLPTATLCDIDIPAILSGVYSDENDMDDNELEWKTEKDYLCSQSGYYYIGYTDQSYLNSINHTIPNKSADGLYDRCDTFCTSSSLDKKDNCGTLPCFIPEYKNKELKRDCHAYNNNHLLYCMCKPLLTKYISSYGFYYGPQYLWKTEIPCRDYLTTYTFKNSLIFLAAAVVVIVNISLKNILRFFANFERHQSESNKASAIVIKLFLSQLLNTGVIVLIANAKLKNLPIFEKIQFLFQGNFPDFIRDWYTVVGVGISTTMGINVFIPQIGPLLQTYIIYPFIQFYKKYQVITQDQMNELYAGPAFDISLRYPLILNILFVTMLYSSGVPILLPLASLAFFISYQLDKLTILRLYSVKTAYNEELGKVAIAMLPWALLIHLGFAMWMYGNPDLLQSEILNITFIAQKIGLVKDINNINLQHVNSMYNEILHYIGTYDLMGTYGILPKIIRINCFPFFILFLLLIFRLVILRILTEILYPFLSSLYNFIYKIYSIIFCCFIKNERNNSIKKRSNKITPNDTISCELTVENYPEFCGYYERPVPKTYEPDTLAGEEIINKNYLIRKWTGDTLKRGIHRKKNDRMYTWEAMAAPVKTYSINENEKYKNAINELYFAKKNATERHLDNQSNKINSNNNNNNNNIKSKDESNTRPSKTIDVQPMILHDIDSTNNSTNELIEHPTARIFPIDEQNNNM